MTSLEPLMCQHPILSSATLNYREDCKYSAEHQHRNADEIYAVTHTLTGEKCLVKDLILDGKAIAICTVVAPWAMYRGIFKASETPKELPTGEVQIKQQVPVHTEDFEPPLKIQPAIVVIDPPPLLVLGEQHGVDDIWYGAEITLDKGAILTDHHWWESTLGESILHVKKAHEGELAKGSFEVSVVPEQGLYFSMKVSPELYDPIHHPGNRQTNAHVRSLYAAAFAEGLAQLQERYKEPDEWRSHSNLRSLYTHLKQRDLPTWDDKTGKRFRPNQIVAALAPHEIYRNPKDESKQEDIS